MAGTIKMVAAPAFLTGAAANIYTPPNAAVNVVITQINIANVTGSAATFTLYRGATGGSAAGTELFKAVSVGANSTSSYTFYQGMLMTSTDFLSGLASATSTLTITVMGYYVAA